MVGYENLSMATIQFPSSKLQIGVYLDVPWYMPNPLLNCFFMTFSYFFYNLHEENWTEGDGSKHFKFIKSLL